VSVLASASIEHTSIGRIVVPPGVPRGYTLFYTTIDFDGRIDERITDFVRPATLASCAQVHGVTVHRVEDRRSRLSGQAGLPVLHEPQCDALWTDQKSVALGIKTADCLPVSLIDPQRGIIANIHSGWRGTVAGITVVTLDAVPLDPASSFAYLGPSIRVCCFEVGEEVAVQFDSRFVDRARGPKPHVDIAALTVALLRQRSFDEGRIIDTGLCTRCNAGVAQLLGCSVAEQPGNPGTQQPLFHSFRRDKRGGRNLAIVAQ
jgi:YfiH family protein